MFRLSTKIFYEGWQALQLVVIVMFGAIGSFMLGHFLEI